jgi:glyoxylase-like metal-dependent hydrolase (beta-lactamase superfamily II)
MMQRERVTEDIYIFTSDLYVHVTAGIIVTTEGLILVDTLLYPEETLQIKNFIESRLKQPVIYIINTHHHADHTTGTSFFGNVPLISHMLCRELLNTRGRESLERSKENASDMATVELVLPSIVFDDKMILCVGNKTLEFEHSPGHSPDSITVLVKEDNVLFAADTVMPIPYFVDGSYDDFLTSLKNLQGRGFENIVQGHGEIILRGEVEKKIKSDINYLEKLRIAVDKALVSSTDETKIERALASIKVGACGKSHILLNGAVEQLHYQNVLALAEQRRERVLLQTE